MCSISNDILSTNNGLFVVDIQGFQYGNSTFLCREIAVVHSDSYVTKFIDLNNCSVIFQKQVRGLTKKCTWCRMESQTILELRYS